MRRFIRLTNAFSNKKNENLEAAVALQLMWYKFGMWYDFGRVHQTLRVTPATEAGVLIASGRWPRLALAVDSI